MKERNDTFNEHRERRRKRLRLKNYDYSAPGTYFVTICIHNRDCLLGEVVAGSVHTTVFGRLVEEAWRSLAERYSYVELDECIVMPNHFHGIVTIGQPGAANSTGRAGKSLGSLVAVFKTASANQINRSRGTLAKAVWQRGFYDHVIRNEEALARIRRYIVENPAAWPADPENPALISQGDRSRR